MDLHEVQCESVGELCRQRRGKEGDPPLFHQGFPPRHTSPVVGRETAGEIRGPARGAVKDADVRPKVFEILFQRGRRDCQETFPSLLLHLLSPRSKKGTVGVQPTGVPGGHPQESRDAALLGTTSRRTHGQERRCVTQLPLLPRRPPARCCQVVLELLGEGEDLYHEQFRGDLFRERENGDRKGPPLLFCQSPVLQGVARGLLFFLLVRWWETRWQGVDQGSRCLMFQPQEKLPIGVGELLVFFSFLLLSFLIPPVSSLSPNRRTHVLSLRCIREGAKPSRRKPNPLAAQPRQIPPACPV
mmetsp:Transcript_5580/g.12927  ORF Transcript_5580/g.12927 Transcript_5580/m.12927 type:complete len:300 (-) Transcript_5580:671-1570(-)